MFDEKKLLQAKERRNIRRQLLHLSAVFFLIYTPYRCLECIQSSLNFEEGLGSLSIGVLQGGNFVSCLLFGAPFVYTFGPKYSLFVSFFAHTLFIVANYIPTWATMIPSSLLTGVMSAMIWISQGTYVTILAQRYAENSQQDLMHILSKFSAVFHLFWGASSPVGNLLASLILGYTRDGDLNACDRSNTSYTSLNSSSNHGSIALLSNGANWTGQDHGLLNTTACHTDTKHSGVCGANHCPYMVEHLEVLEKPSKTLVYVLMTTFLLFNVLGLLLCAFLKPLNSARNSSATKKLTKTLKLMSQPNLLLMMVPFFLVGMLPGAFYGNFAQSFVSCVFGIGMVGYAMMCEGLGFATACLLCGPLSHVVPRQMQYIFVFASLILTALSWLLWVPSPDQFWIVIGMSFVYGLNHGLHRTHMSVLTSLLFPNDPEPAFAHYHLGRTLALCVTFAVSPHLCFNVKTYWFLLSLCLGAVSILGLELKLKCCADKALKVTTDVDGDVTREQMLAINKAQRVKMQSITDSLPGSLSGSCTNINIQA